MTSNRTDSEASTLSNVSGEPIYLLDRKLLWRNFKAIHDKVAVKDGGPEPVNFDRILWRMNRDGLLYVWLDGTNEEDTVFTGLELPKNRTVHVVTNGSDRRSGAHSALNNGSGNTTAPMPSPDLGEGKEK